MTLSPAQSENIFQATRRSSIIAFGYRGSVEISTVGKHGEPHQCRVSSLYAGWQRSDHPSESRRRETSEEPREFREEGDGGKYCHSFQKFIYSMYIFTLEVLKTKKSVSQSH